MARKPVANPKRRPNTVSGTRGSGRQTVTTTTPKPQRGRRKKEGIPGVDYSGVHPETGKYTVVRGNYKGEWAKDRAKNLKRTDKYQTFKKGEVDPRAPKTPADRKRNKKICGAQRTGRSSSGPGICCRSAGWGTAHPGYGSCRDHGGLTESHEIAVQRQIATDLMEMYGRPNQNMDPNTALLQEVQRSSGHVEWLAELINSFEDKRLLTQYTEATGVQPSVWIDLYHKERDRLVSSSKAALAAGVAERQVRLFAMVIQRIFQDERLAITNVQKAIMPAVVRDHMLALDSAGEEYVIDVESRPSGARIGKHDVPGMAIHTQDDPAQ
jgi:hypothetical protein